MSAGLFFTDTPEDRGAPPDVGFGAQPGDNGRDGIGIATIEQIPGTYELLVTLDDGRREIFPMPAGPEGRDGITPEFVAGDVVYGALDVVPKLTPRRIALGVFALDLVLPNLALATQAATAAAGSAAAAAGAVSTATGSANAADASAQASAGSATAAQAARAGAEAALDAFDDRYLGAKASDPATDNDGNALLVGALYYKTGTQPGMRIWTGALWDKAYTTITGGVTSFKGREGAVVPAADDYAVADITGLPAALATKLDASNPTIMLLQSSIAAIRKDLLLTELYAAEVKGDRLNMSAGIVDPYNDASDFTFSDAIYNTSAKTVQLGPLAGYEQKYYDTFTASPPSSVYSQTAGGTGEGFLTYIFNSHNSNTRATLSAGYTFNAKFGGQPLKSVEITVEAGSGANAVLWIIDPNTGATVGTINTVGDANNGWKRYIVDLTAPLTNGVRIYVASSAGFPYLRWFRGYTARVSDFIVPNAISGFGQSYPNIASNLAYFNGGITGNTAPYAYTVDLGSPKLISAFNFYGHEYQKYFGFQIEGSNDLVTWNSYLGQKEFNEGAGPSDQMHIVIGVNTSVAYRYYRASQYSSAVGTTSRRATAFGILGVPSTTPIITSGVFNTSNGVVPTTARLGLQLLRYGNPPLTDMVAEVTRNNGATWTAVPLAKAADQTDNFEYYEGMADISAQASGSVMRYRFRVLNNRQIDVGGALLQWS